MDHTKLKELKRDIETLRSGVNKLQNSKNTTQRENANRIINNTLFLLKKKYNLHENDIAIELENYGLDNLNALLYDLRNIVSIYEEELLE